jgi:hypothetical protein
VYDTLLSMRLTDVRSPWCMWIECGTATVLCKVKRHRVEPINEVVDDLVDLVRTIDPECVLSVYYSQIQYRDMVVENQARDFWGLLDGVSR